MSRWLAVALIVVGTIVVGSWGAPVDAAPRAQGGGETNAVSAEMPTPASIVIVNAGAYATWSGGPALPAQSNPAFNPARTVDLPLIYGQRRLPASAESDPEIDIQPTPIAPWEDEAPITPEEIPAVTILPTLPLPGESQPQITLEITPTPNAGDRVYLPLIRRDER